MQTADSIFFINENRPVIATGLFLKYELYYLREFS